MDTREVTKRLKDRQTQRNWEISIPKVTAFCAVVLAVGLSLSSHVVPAGNRGVVEVLGHVQDKPLTEGFHFVNPFAKVIDFDARRQSAKATNVIGTTLDKIRVMEDISVNYEYDPAKLPAVFHRFGPDHAVQAKFIAPAVAETINAVTARYTSEDLTSKRAQFKQDVTTALQAALAQYSITVTGVDVERFQFDDKFAQLVQAKVESEIKHHIVETDLETAKGLSRLQSIALSMQQTEAKAHPVKSAAAPVRPSRRAVAVKHVARPAARHSAPASSASPASKPANAAIEASATTDTKSEGLAESAADVKPDSQK